MGEKTGQSRVERAAAECEAARLILESDNADTVGGLMAARIHVERAQWELDETKSAGPLVAMARSTVTTLRVQCAECLDALVDALGG